MKALSRRTFLSSAAASVGLCGCRSVGLFGEKPQLTFGVISDIHVTTPDSTKMFRRALRYFRLRGVNAVMVAGDLSDWGLKSGLIYMKDAWDAEMANSGITPLFITGNHDWDGWWYGDMTLDMHVQGYSEDEALSVLGMGKCWEEIFNEPFEEIRKRTVNGYTFISAEWKGREKSENDAAVVKWFEEHKRELDPAKPFFFFRHAPLPGTVSSGAGRPGSMALTEELAKFPNCIAFNGHTHWTFNDERSIWQGGFTAISIPSMSYTSIPKGYENGSDSRRGDSKLGMPRLPSREDLKAAQGFVVSLYLGRMAIERYDFEENKEGAAPWIVPMPPSSSRPYTFAARAKTTPVPQFPAGASVRTYTTNADTRNGHWAIFMSLEFPSAHAAGGRVFDYEVKAVGEDGKVMAVKRFLSPGFYKAACHEPEIQVFRFNAMELPETGRYRLKVTARNCFGAESAPLVSRVFESKPGKDKVKKRS
ncbi:MAG: metallophosphoesterase [Kiritimatiellae bacterium]|nr:metallophosphoesterase [Kiritimatiellia bacterium]MDD4025285.1 metallophosphoesterase [Kiritimatiellia bacterium]